MARTDPERSPIFVIGSGRSGTTLLRQMLNAHSRIHLTHEAGFYSAAAPHRKRRAPRAFLERYFGSFPFAWLNLTKESVRAELGSGEVSYADVFSAVMKAKAKQFGKVRFGDKTPYDAAYVGRMLDDYPDARIVHIMRDPRATVASLARMPWAPSSLGMVNLFAIAQVQAVYRFRDRIHEVRLEDLVQDPKEEMSKILDFVGEEWDDKVLDHVQYAPADAPPYPWLAGAHEARKGPSDSWKKALTPSWIRIIEGTQRKIMERYGYTRADLENEPSFLRRLGTVALDIPLSLLAIGRALRVFFALQREPPLSAEEVQRRVLHLNPAALRAMTDFELPPLPKATAQQPP